MRYDQCPDVFFSATALAATAIYWLCDQLLIAPRYHAGFMR